MSYRGFTWNLTYGDAMHIRDLLSRYEAGKPIHKVDQHFLELYIAKCTIFMELSPDGTTSRSATADA